MSCERTRQALRRNFDHGMEPATGCEAHVASCAACRAYCRQLEALAAALAELPLEETAPGLTRRVWSPSGTMASATVRLGHLAAAAAAVLMTIAAVLGWLFPVAVNPAAWWAEIESWLPTVDWDNARTTAVSQLEQAWEPVASELGGVAYGFPPLLVWSCLATVAVLLVVLNAFGALKLREAPPEPENNNARMSARPDAR